MTQHPRPRALLAALLAVGLASCADDAPPPASTFAPLSYGYLTPLRLNVASISIEDGRRPGAGGLDHVESLSPVPPFDALSQMAHDRLIADGNSGQARFIVQDASIVQGPGRLDGALAVRLDVETSGGTRSGFVEARVVRSQGGGAGDPDGGREAAYRLVKAMMDDMNVELEYRIRQNLRDYLQVTDPASPAGAPVRTEQLPPPPGARLAPPATPGT